MNENLIWILGLLIPAILTLVGNYIFYTIIKKKVDQSIEEYRIAYSGIFKEKVDIYRELLNQTYNLKIKIHRYYYSGNQLDAKEIFPDVEKFIHYYLVNQPFLSSDMLDSLMQIREKFQFVLDNSYHYHSVSNVSGVEPSEVTKMELKFVEVGNLLKDKNAFKDLENLIIKEMRRDLKTDNF